MPVTRILTFAVAFLSVLCLASAALGSDRVAQLRKVPLDGPRVYDVGLRWAEARDEATNFNVRGPNGFSVQPVPSLPGGGGYASVQYPLLGLGDSSTALGIFSQDPNLGRVDGASSTLRSVRLSRPEDFNSSRECPTASPSAFGSQGERYSASTPDCRLEVRESGQTLSDFGSFIGAKSPSLPRVAGDFAAAVVEGAVVLRDLATATERTIALASVPASRVTALDLRADGAVVAVVSTDPLVGGALSSQIVIIPGMAGAPTRLPVRARRALHASWAGENLLVLDAPSESPYSGVGILTIQTTTGQKLSTIASGVVLQPGRPLFDVNDAGTRVAWSRRTCAGAEIRVADIGAPPEAAQPGRCRLRLASRPRLNKRTLTFRLAGSPCGSFARCEQTFLIGPPGGGRPFIAADTRPSPAVSTRFRVTLSRKNAHRLARWKRFQLELGLRDVDTDVRRGTFALQR